MKDIIIDDCAAHRGSGIHPIVAEEDNYGCWRAHASRLEVAEGRR